MALPFAAFFTKYRFPILFCLCHSIASIILPFLYMTSDSVGTQFQLGTSVFSWLITADRLIFGLSAVFAAYFGGKAKRKAKWIGCGFALIATGCFLFALTAFITPLPPVEKDESRFWQGIYHPATAEDISHPHNLLESYWGKRFPADVQQHLNYTGYKTVGTMVQSNKSKRAAIEREIDNMLADAISNVREEVSFGIGDAGDQEENEDTSSESHSLVKRQMPDFDFPDSTRDRLKAGFEAAVIGLIWFGDSYDFFAQQVFNLTNDPEIFDRLMKSARLPFGYCRNASMLIRERIQNQTCLQDAPNSSLMAMVIAFAAFAMMGYGCGSVCTIGLPYVEDLIGWKSFPKFIVSLTSLQFLFALFGIFFGLVCEMLIYSTMNAPFGLTAIDPRWVGAWWLGLLLISIFLMALAIAILYFDSKSTNHLNIANGVNENGHQIENEIPMKEKTEETNQNGTAGQHATTNFLVFRGIFDAVSEVIRPPVFATLAFAMMFHAMSFYGYCLFLPTYLTNNFRFDTFLNGSFMAFSTGMYLIVGIGIGATFVYWTNFNSRKLTLWTLGCSFLIVALTLCQEWLGCNNVINQIQETSSKYANGVPYWQSCPGCICESASLYPVCANDSHKTAYYSPCHAGCTNFTYQIVNMDVKFQFDYCACAYTPRTLVSRDFCQDDCSGTMAIYFFLFDLMAVASGILIVPSIIIAMRSTRHEYRALALAILIFFVYIFGMLPASLLYRFITDSACYFWKSTCNTGRGFCEMYDTQTLRERFHGFAAILNLMAYLFYSMVWYYSKNLTLTKPTTDNVITPTPQFVNVDIGNKKENDQNGETVQNGGETQEQTATFVGKM